MGKTTNDEGEPQTKFLMPGEGGSYRKSADGKLTRVEHPTKAAETATPMRARALETKPTASTNARAVKSRAKAARQAKATAPKATKAASKAPAAAATEAKSPTAASSDSSAGK